MKKTKIFVSGLLTLCLVSCGDKPKSHSSDESSEDAAMVDDSTASDSSQQAPSETASTDSAVMDTAVMDAVSTDTVAIKEVASALAAQASVPFKSSRFKENKTVDCDGIECSFSFSIDWPVEGNPETLSSVRNWIANAVLNKKASFSTAKELSKAVIKNDYEEGYIGKDVDVNIKDNGDKIEVKSVVSWSAGYSVSSPMGATTRTAVFDAANGSLISEKVVKEGDDE